MSKQSKNKPTNKPALVQTMADIDQVIELDKTKMYTITGAANKFPPSSSSSVSVPGYGPIP